MQIPSSPGMWEAHGWLRDARGSHLQGAGRPSNCSRNKSPCLKSLAIPSQCICTGRCGPGDKAFRDSASGNGAAGVCLVLSAACERHARGPAEALRARSTGGLPSPQTRAYGQDPLSFRIWQTAARAVIIIMSGDGPDTSPVFHAPQGLGRGWSRKSFWSITVRIGTMTHGREQGGRNHPSSSLCPSESPDHRVTDTQLVAPTRRQGYVCCP